MDKLNFYTADLDYVKYLQEAEKKCRGFSRVPNMEYINGHKQKFLCGIVLRVNDVDYYVPVTSYKQQKSDNFLIKADNGQVVGSLRFNYMFPIPKELIAIHIISNEPDRAYRTLLAQELRYCIKNQDKIMRLAERTYKRVLLGKDMGLVVNSCDFKLLEKEYHKYTIPQKGKGIKKSAYILMDASNEPEIHKAELNTNFVKISIFTVRNFEEAKEKVIALWCDDYGAIELCGAFGRDLALELIRLTKNEIPIGYVTNESEQQELVANFWLC